MTHYEVAKNRSSRHGPRISFSLLEVGVYYNERTRNLNWIHVGDPVICPQWKVTTSVEGEGIGIRKYRERVRVRDLVTPPHLKDHTHRP